MRDDLPTPEVSPQVRTSTRSNRCDECGRFRPWADLTFDPPSMGADAFDHLPEKEGRYSLEFWVNEWHVPWGGAEVSSGITVGDLVPDESVPLISRGQELENERNEN